MLRERLYPLTSLCFTASVPETACLLPHRIHSLDDVFCGARHLSPSFHSRLEEESPFPSYKGSLLIHRHALLDNNQMGTTLIIIQDCQVQTYIFSTIGRPLDFHALGCWTNTLAILPHSGDLQRVLPEQHTVVGTLICQCSHPAAWTGSSECSNYSLIHVTQQSL